MTEVSHLTVATFIGAISLASGCGQGSAGPIASTDASSGGGDVSSTASSSAVSTASVSGAGVGESSASTSGPTSTSTTGSGGGDPSAVNPKKHGYITVYNFSGALMGQPKQSYFAVAQFDAAPDATQDTCTITTLGACSISTCIPGDYGTPMTESAGIVTIGDGNETMTMTPDAMGAYAPESNLMTSLWEPGDTVTISATGGIVPAFQMSVIGASGGDIASPPPPPLGKPVPIDRMKDLVLTWNGGGAGNVNVLLTAYPASDVSVACAFPSAAGTGTVPKEALGALPAGQLGSYLIEGGGEEHTIAAGDWSVSVSLVSEMTWGGQWQSTDYQATN